MLVGGNVVQRVAMVHEVTVRDVRLLLLLLLGMMCLLGLGLGLLERMLPLTLLL